MYELDKHFTRIESRRLTNWSLIFPIYRHVLLYLRVFVAVYDRLQLKVNVSRVTKPRVKTIYGQLTDDKKEKFNWILHISTLFNQNENKIQACDLS